MYYYINTLFSPLMCIIFHTSEFNLQLFKSNCCLPACYIHILLFYLFGENVWCTNVFVTMI